MMVSAVIVTEPPNEDLISAFNLKGDIGYVSVSLNKKGLCGKSTATIVKMPNKTVSTYGIYNKEGKDSSTY